MEDILNLAWFLLSVWALLAIGSAFWMVRIARQSLRRQSEIRRSHALARSQIFDTRPPRSQEPRP